MTELYLLLRWITYSNSNRSTYETSVKCLEIGSATRLGTHKKDENSTNYDENTNILSLQVAVRALDQDDEVNWVFLARLLAYSSCQNLCFPVSLLVYVLITR